MKRKICCLAMLIAFMPNIFLSSFAYSYDNPNTVLSELQSMVSTCNESANESRIVLLKIKNINLESYDQYQWIHDNLQKNNPKKEICDIYTNSFGKIIIPEKNIETINDDTINYNQQDIDFKEKLGKLGITNISLIDKTKNIKIPSMYYDIIVSSIVKFYNKYFYLTDKCVNCVNGMLFSGFEINEIKKDKNAVGEFLALKDKVVLDSKLFYESNADGFDERKKLIEYTIYHEMGHSIELKMCKEIFKDLNLNNISKRDLEKLSVVYFSGKTEVAEIIMNSVLNKMNIPDDAIGKKNFIRDNLSEYANTNASEFLAEAITYGFLAGDTGKAISKLVDEEIADIFKHQGDVYIKLKMSVLKFLTEEIGLKNDLY